MSSISKLAHVYNPANQNDEQLLNGFIMRRGNVFSKIIRELESTRQGKSAAHFLIEAQRGMGKTSLLLRLKIEIQQSPKLSHLLPIQLAEEQYGIFNLCQLWEHIAEALEDLDLDQEHDLNPAGNFNTLVAELEAAEEQGNYAEECFNILEKQLIKNKKQLVLLLDNFGDVLDRFSDNEQARLRDIFHTSTHIQLIATSAKALEYTYKHDKAFYDFFQILHLKGLDKKETHQLLTKLAETENQQAQIKKILKTQSARIETIRRLTGGVPRTIVLLYEIFMDESANVYQDLESILDRVTPLYKHRMDDLPKQQQAIMNTLALNWDGMSTREITEKLNNEQFTSKKISSQLRQLEKNALVTSKLIDKKNKIYSLQERFFNIWYLMRFGRKKNKTKVLWLVRFFEEWCTPDELKQRVRQQHIQAAKEGRLHPRGGVMLAEALAPLVRDYKLQHELISETREALRPVMSDIDKQLSQSDKEIFDTAYKAQKNKDFNKAIPLWKKLIKKNDEVAMFNLALLYNNEYKDYEQAIHYYKMAVEKNHTLSMTNLAIFYGNKYNDHKQEIHYYKMAIKQGNVRAMNNLGNFYEIEYKDYEQAIHYYKMAIERHNVRAMVNLASLYEREYTDYKQAIHYYKMAIERGHGGAMILLIWLYDTQGANKEKQDCLKLAIKSCALKKDSLNIYALSIAQLWNNQFQASIKSIKELVALNDDYILKFPDWMTDYFILLLAKKQLEPAYKLFKQIPQLQDQFKPVYYALMTLLKDQYPKEYLKMGSELEETVQEILQKVEEKAVKYA